MSSLDHDRRHIERLYKRLDAERAGAEAELVAAQRATGSSPGEMSLREAAVRALGARLARLRAGADGLCFGRMDAADGSRTYVGRTGLRDDEHEPVLIDRRARAARPFYCATAAHPEGLLRRRHFVTRGPSRAGRARRRAGRRGRRRRRLGRRPARRARRPAQWRARCATAARSATVRRSRSSCRCADAVGDLAQRRSTAGSRSWADALEPCAPGRFTHRVLGVCYRAPAEIMAVAADLLDVHDPGHTSPEPVRSTGVRPLRGGCRRTVWSRPCERRSRPRLRCPAPSP